MFFLDFDKKKVKEVFDIQDSISNIQPPIRYNWNFDLIKIWSQK